MKQSDVFKAGEGDAWWERNKDKIGKPDPVIELIAKYAAPRFAYEVGCANGWRLVSLRDRFDCKVGGIDPARFASGGNIPFPVIKELHCGDATKLKEAEGCDVLIYGFCLYLCDPEDYFTIVQEGDRVLKDGGYLIIHDFDYCARPFRIPYKHKEGVWSHHVAFEELWAGHPWYKILEQQSCNDESFTIMKKNSATAWSRK